MENNKRNISMDAMEEELRRNETLNKKTGFDEKNYLNVRLGTNETSKELRIRLLPIDGKPFKLIHVHNVKVPKEIVKSGFKSYICLHKTEGIDTSKYGNRCPFCEMSNKAYKAMEEATNDADKKRYLDIFKENHSSVAYIARCIERGKEEEGVKFWKFNDHRDKSDPHGQIMNLYESRRTESMEDGGEPENILDLYEGKDLKVTVNHVAELPNGQKKTSISIIDCGKNKPLSADEAQMDAWIDDEKKWSDVFGVKPYEYLDIVMGGDVPWYDREQKVWVKKEAADRKSANINNDANEEIENIEKDLVNMARNEEKSSNMEDDMELPF